MAAVGHRGGEPAARIADGAQGGTLIGHNQAGEAAEFLIGAGKLDAAEPFERTEGGDICLLYTSDAADDLLCVDLGGSRIIKKKKTKHHRVQLI